MSNESKSLFSDMEDLGFGDIKNINLYQQPEDDEKMDDEKKSPLQDSVKKEIELLYDKKVICPVCDNLVYAKSVKVSAPRIVKKDSDLFIRYASVNPYFYDVWLCNNCGYAAMKKDFLNIKDYQHDQVLRQITVRWKGRIYPEVYDVDIAIERYKLSLLNYVAINAKHSSKAMNCLKIAWMYRLKGDESNEMEFLKQALEGLEHAYLEESFPIYGMDRFTTMYLIGELNRRVGDFDKAMQWFSKVITTPAVNPKLKELARDQKDLIKSAKKEENTFEDNNSSNKKTGFFKSLFKGKKHNSQE
ncbi:MAG: DUF2225 domain-containing protein [Clostridiales bacterium]|nr:DUF2225 domain-containing protein [Clostridiales bacterium]